MNSVYRPILRALPLALLVGSLPFLGACDNVACVFGPTNCQDVPGNPDGDPTASSVSLPQNGNFLNAGPPALLDVIPDTTDMGLVGPQAPIVLCFSESLNQTSVTNAFEIVENITGQVFPLITPFPLLDDGRVVVLQPFAPLPLEMNYVVRVAEGAVITDVSGQVWVPPSDGVIALYGVTSLFDPQPQVVATFPAAGETNVSELGSITVIFDRPMVRADFDQESFQVLVNGVPASQNPPPLPAVPSSGAPVDPPNVAWTWINAPVLGPVFGPREALPLGALVSLTLSPDGALLFADDEDGLDLDETVINFTLTNAGAPVEVIKPFEPMEIIGGPDLVGVVPLLQVELQVAALAGDVLNLFLFGEDVNGGTETATVARTVALLEGEQLINVMPEQLGLEDAQGFPLFGDGDLRIAASLTRGGIASAVRLADIDSVTPGVQDLSFDTTPPTLLGLGLIGENTTAFTSDQRDLVVIGRASEELGGVQVTSDFGDNFVDAEIPPPVLTGQGGLFVARPVVTGMLDPTAPNPTFTLRLFDRALNETEALFGTFVPVGGVGPGTALPGPDVTVRVVSATTLQPLANARVVVHRRDGAGTITEIGGPGFTDDFGLALMSAALSGDTLVTVDMEGFDLFTFDRVPTSQITVRLEPSGLLDTSSSGAVVSVGPVLGAADVVLRDSRAGLADPQSGLAGSCDSIPPGILFQCPFGPLGIRPSRFGAPSVAVALEPPIPAAWTAPSYLLAFGLGDGLLPAQVGETQVDLAVGLTGLLSVLPAEGQALPLPMQVFSIAGAPGLGRLNGGPVVTVEALSPGVPGPLLVGLGADFPDDPENFLVLSAIPGAADGIDDGDEDELGSLVTSGQIEPDLFLRGEVSDADGNRLVARPRVSNSMGFMLVSDVPQLLSPLPDGSSGDSGGAGFAIAVQDVIPDAAMVQGLVQVRIEDSEGRGWELWTVDPPDSETFVQIFAPNIGTSTLGGTPLVPGPASATVAVFSWTSLDTSAFLWSDVDREHELASYAAAIQFTLD